MLRSLLIKLGSKLASRHEFLNLNGYLAAFDSPQTAYNNLLHLIFAIHKHTSAHTDLHAQTYTHTCVHTHTHIH